MGSLQSLGGLGAGAHTLLTGSNPNKCEHVNMHSVGSMKMFFKDIHKVGPACSNIVSAGEYMPNR